MNLQNSKVTAIILVNVVLVMAVFSVALLNQKDPQGNFEPLPPTFPPSQGPVSPPPEMKLNKEQALETITENECNEILSWLAHDDREGRMSGKRGNVASAEYIAEDFKRNGLEVEMQRFDIRRMNPGPHNEQGDDFTENIIGIIRGKSDRQIIVGAHMDHIGYGPSMSRSGARNQIHNGADDNASGTSAVLELAEAFSKMEQPNHTLVFICFSAEEMGLIGSRYYVSQLDREEKDKIDLMVNFDMVGWLKGQRTINVSGVREVPEVVSIIEGLNGKYPFEARATGSGSGGSDHAPFGNAGIPYAFFHTGSHDHYHTPTDDVERIDFAGLTQITRFAFEMIVEFDQAKLVRKATITYPLLNDTVHDHGHSDVPFPSLESYESHIHEHGHGGHVHSHEPFNKKDFNLVLLYFPHHPFTAESIHNMSKDYEISQGIAEYNDFKLHSVITSPMIINNVAKHYGLSFEEMARYMPILLINTKDGKYLYKKFYSDKFIEDDKVNKEKFLDLIDAPPAYSGEPEFIDEQLAPSLEERQGHIDKKDFNVVLIYSGVHRTYPEVREKILRDYDFNNEVVKYNDFVKVDIRHFHELAETSHRFGIPPIKSLPILLVTTKDERFVYRKFSPNLFFDKNGKIAGSVVLDLIYNPTAHKYPVTEEVETNLEQVFENSNQPIRTTND